MSLDAERTGLSEGVFAALKLESRGGVLASTDATVKIPLDITDVHVSQFRIRRGVFTKPVTFKGCTIERLTLDDVSFGAQVSFIDCTIATLDIRCKVAKEAVLVTNTRLGELLTFGIPKLSIQKARLSRDLRIIDSAQISLTDIQVPNLVVSSSVQNIDACLDASDLVISGAIEVSGLSATSISMEKVSANRVQISRCTVDAVKLSQFHVERGTAISVQGMTIGTKLEVLNSALGSLDIRLGGSAASAFDPELTIGSTRIATDLTLQGHLMARLFESSVSGVLRLRDAGESKPRIELGQYADASAIELPPGAFRRVSDVNKFARELLGNDRASELGVLYRSLRDRPVEQDLAYFAQRTAESRTTRGIHRLYGFIQGHVLGWGVLPSKPIAAFVLGIIATTGAAAMLRGVQSASLAADLAESLVIAISFWLGAGIWTPEEIANPLWSALALVCTAFGVVLITVAVGIAIRRLVR